VHFPAETPKNKLSALEKVVQSGKKRQGQNRSLNNSDLQAPKTRSVGMSTDFYFDYRWQQVDKFTHFTGLYYR
jgi:hypothetical protein